MAEVILKNVRKVFDRDVVAVDDANIDIKDQEFVVLVGPSGCGKSTTLRMVAGLEEVTSGEISIDGRLDEEAWSHAPVASGFIQGQIGIFFQNRPPVPPALSPPG